MRQIATLPEDRARRFADHLLALRIDTRLIAEGDGVAVWVCDEDQVAQARQELEAFRRDPADTRFRAAPAAPRLPEAEPAAPARPAAEAEGDDESAFPESERLVTIAVIAVCVVAAVATNFGKEEPPATLNLLRIAPNVAAPSLDAVRAGEVWRLITPVFVHFGVLHLVFNMLALLSLGGRVEVVLGPARLLGLMLLFAVPCNLAEYYLDWSFQAGLSYDQPHANFGGMSGVLYGLFGYMWVRGRLEPDGGLGLPPDTVVILMGWFVLCLFGAFDTPTTRVGNVAHAAGLLVGAAAGAWAGRRAWRRRGEGA